MTYNDDDIIEEMMKSNQKYFDKIFVLDGSNDKTEEIIRSFDNVKYFLKDQDIYPNRKIADGARQFLIEKAQEMYGKEGWFTLLHGDEIFVDDPNEVAERAEKAKAERINWHSLNFFLHASQKETYNPNMPIQEQVIYYNPGTLEIRQFRNKPNIYYNLNQVYNVVPTGIGLKTLFDFPIFKHYVTRSITQKQKKSGGVGAVRGELSANHKVNLDEVFKDKCSPHFAQTRIYDGSFHELHPKNRPAFFYQWLAWRHYRPIEWGVWEKPVKAVQKIFRA